MSRLTLGAVLVAVWLLLWGEWSVANVVGGVAVAAMVFVVFPTERRRWPRRVLRPVAVARLAGFFLAQLVVSNARLTAELLRRRRAIRSAVVPVRLDTTSPMLVTAVCNLAALSPATLVVDVTPADDGGHLLAVHVLVFGPQGSTDDGVQTIVRYDELVVAAFGERAP